MSLVPWFDANMCTHMGLCVFLWVMFILCNTVIYLHVYVLICISRDYVLSIFIYSQTCACVHFGMNSSR